MFRLSLGFIIVLCINGIRGKYLEGELRTHENWAFLARFCFLSEEGEFEYRIEYNEEQGSPNLLLYYDTDDQWPTVYKSNKTCQEKESVLKIEQNQVINLTTEYPRYRDLAGCVATAPMIMTTPAQRYTVSIPTPKSRRIKQVTVKQDGTTIQITSTTSVATTVSDFNYTTEEYNAITDSLTTEGSLGDFTDVYDKQFNSEDIFETDSGDNGSDLTSTTSTSILAIPSTTNAPIKKRSVITKPTPITYPSRTVICQNARRFQSSRERWWFVAVSNCNGTKGIDVKYKLLMTNGPPGDYWHEHFSADEFYILPVLMAFSLAYSFLLLAIVLCSVELKSRQLLHSTYKLFVLSAVVQFFGILLQSCAYLKYAVNGIGAPAAKTFGRMFMGTSETCFLLLLLLLAKGYTVTRGRLPLAASVKLTIFMCLYSVTYICIFIYAAKVFDPGEVLYLYESPAGYGLIILRITAWLMFIYSTVFTLKHYPEKSNFYYPFNICGTLWFIAGPAFILSANSYIDKWVRESVVCAVLLLIAFGGHLMFLILTMPSMANKNFPYHVRTSQIGIMEMTGAAGASTIEHFGHHVYEPTTNLTEQTVIIPLTRRTEEIFGGLYTQHLHSNFATRAAHQRSANEEADTAAHAAQGVAMQNVLSWSLAKNYSALDVVVPPHSDNRHDRSTLGSGSSRQTAKSSQQDGTSRRNSSSIAFPNNGQLNESRRSYEQVKEVPLELFTISKTVVKSNGTQQNNEASK